MVCKRDVGRMGRGGVWCQIANSKGGVRSRAGAMGILRDGMRCRTAMGIASDGVRYHIARRILLEGCGVRRKGGFRAAIPLGRAFSCRRSLAALLVPQLLVLDSDLFIIPYAYLLPLDSSYTVPD